MFGSAHFKVIVTEPLVSKKGKTRSQLTCLETLWFHWVWWATTANAVQDLLHSSAAPQGHSNTFAVSLPRTALRALVHFAHFAHFAHLLWVLSAFTQTEPAEFSALKVPGWRTRNGEKMKCKTMDTTRTKRAPSWLRSGRGGALSAAFHKKSTFILAGLVSRADLRPSLPP